MRVEQLPSFVVSPSDADSLGAAVESGITDPVCSNTLGGYKKEAMEIGMAGNSVSKA